MPPLFTIDPKRMSSIINYKPPGPGDTYQNPDNIMLYDAEGNPTGIHLGAGHHVPNPDEICCLDFTCIPDIPIEDCLELQGVPLSEHDCM